ncbi:LacI family DNA-binding transcriptional regulator [Bacillus sp. 03113]|uniref:LacI family DNA-binding transcriptional regulator n=1 Tax=Bacillus sp. 03113 TaxID=2578211 RepID=UPI001141D806|nr:LacI family DNA-binding transcriptional regulator [Bacillus sp. 03113]
MSVTIKDVARLANVAPSTVSRVISNSSRISEKTKEKVRQAMEQLGYHPNFNARSLANQSTQAIGLIMPSSNDIVFQNPFFPTVLRGLSKGAHENRYALYMTTGNTDDAIYDDVVNMVQGGRVDGVVLLYSKVEDKVQSYLLDQGFPFVVIGKPYCNENEITYVDNDNIKAAYDVTKHLIDLGHKHIGYIGGNLKFVVTLERLLGYKQALEEAKLPIINHYRVHEEFLREGGQEAVKELFSLKKHPTALVVADDLMSLGVLNTLDEIGISVPEDMSIISFNNILLSELSRPPITSVDINIFDLGNIAARNLIQKIQNPSEPVKKTIIPHQIIWRKSCLHPKTEKTI